MTARFVSRIRILTLLLLCVVFVIVGRLYVLQVMRGHTYAAKADAQISGPASPLLDRGTIYFTDKNGAQITAAALRNGYSVVVNPTKVVDAPALCQSLTSIIPAVETECIDKATKQGSQYQVVTEHVDRALGSALMGLQKPGLIVGNDIWRWYPGGSLAAQELGFVAYNGDNVEGRYGLERYYNETLQRSEADLHTNFFVELFGGVSSVLSGDQQQGDIVTTIEPSVQAELERQLVSYDEKWHPRLSGGIVMDPQTGEIVAMAVSPTFDLNAFREESDVHVYANPLVDGRYEMGSIIKPLTVAAGVDSGTITEDTTYNDTGFIEVDGKKISNYDGKARGITPIQEILSQSLNVGVSFIATKMGSSTMRSYFLDKYKLGTETGVDLPGELHGINSLQSGRQVEFDTASFGQGMSLTPVETVRALSTIANGGFLVTPHLVREIRYSTGVTRALAWPKKEAVLKPETTTVVSRMLTKVVDTALLHGQYKIEHYSVAAKTGTAQIANPAGGGYYSDRYLHSFFGYFPSYNARFVIFLFGVEPVGAQYASATLSEPWHNLTQFLINYYNIPPDR